MAQKLKFGIVAACDAAYRDQQTGKTIIAGHYAGDIIVPGFPALLNMMFYVEILNPNLVGPIIDFEVVCDKHVQGKVQLGTSPVATGPAVIVLPGIQVLAHGECTLELRVKVGDAKPVTAYRKPIKQGSPLPTP